LRQTIDLRLQAAIFVISLLSGLGIGYMRAKANGGLFIISYALILAVWALTSLLLDSYGSEYSPSISSPSAIIALFCWLTMRCFIAFEGPRIGFLLVFCMWLVPLLTALYQYPESVFREESGLTILNVIVVIVLLIAVQWSQASSEPREPGDNEWGPGACSSGSGD
jgi:hypothetical protein